MKIIVIPKQNLNEKDIENIQSENEVQMKMKK